MGTLEPDRLVVIGPAGGPDHGWTATLNAAEGQWQRVRLGPVYSWNDIADHAATFDAVVVIGRSVLYDMARNGRWSLDSPAPNTAIVDS